jgi:hypothetical protein
VQYLWLDQRLQLKGRVMTTRLVDVFDANGARLFTYSIALDDADCLDAEFEEVALIFAESSGLVAADEIAQLRACCDIALSENASELTAPAAPKSRKGTVVSLVKHRMKRANAGAPSQALRSRLKR